MQLFNEKSKCCKCGCSDIASEYCMGLAGSSRCGYWLGEHIHRKCRNCQYQWPEHCIDMKVSDAS